MRKLIDYLLNEGTIFSRAVLPLLAVILTGLLLVALGWVAPGTPRALRSDEVAEGAPAIDSIIDGRERNELKSYLYAKPPVQTQKFDDWAEKHLCDRSQQTNKQEWGKFADHARNFAASGKGGCGWFDRANARSPLVWHLGILGWIPVALLFAAWLVAWFAAIWVWRAKRPYHWLYRSRVYTSLGHR